MACNFDNTDTINKSINIVINNNSNKINNCTAYIYMIILE